LRALHNAALGILLALLAASIVLVILECEEKIVIILGIAKIAPDA